MTIQDHTKSSISMMITKLDQHLIILEKSWMKKHDVNYHDHDDSISFLWARSVRQVRYSELWICDNVKLLYKDRYVGMRRLIVEKISPTSRLLKYPGRALESLTPLQAGRKTG
jgi:hypothetical protein